MKKKLFRIILPIVVVVALVCRISYINATALTTTTKIYEVGDTVELNGSFTDSAEENTLGYSITVEDAELITYEDFMERFQKPQDYLAKNSRRTVALLKVRIKNDGNATGGISVNRLFLYNKSMSVYFSFDNSYLAIANPEIGSDLMGIRIQPDTELTIYFSFTLEYGNKPDSYLDLMKKGEKTTFYLGVSTYPVKNFIRVEL